MALVICTRCDGAFPEALVLPIGNDRWACPACRARLEALAALRRFDPAVHRFAVELPNQDLLHFATRAAAEACARDCFGSALYALTEIGGDGSCTLVSLGAY